MKVSLIIPMYNEQSIVDGAIDTFYTFLKEKYDDFELIFVSDGSTDGCDNAVALASKKDERIRLCSYSPNRGMQRVCMSEFSQRYSNSFCL